MRCVHSTTRHAAQSLVDAAVMHWPRPLVAAVAAEVELVAGLQRTGESRIQAVEEDTQPATVVQLVALHIALVAPDTGLLRLDMIQEAGMIQVVDTIQEVEMVSDQEQERQPALLV